ncbi:hypothetical protein FERRO_09040 [Ferrovum sp. JA12]|uniref:DUF5666 domain-containing protein n=1 Tax=Ferrovum sp. JA12 TaxID=1356299 RepID=UPI00070285E5|nr:DUF5666 domain-containing protein [Ferrovum sp. JA12]KRH79828.1 hypothetical protein FERRO_09040 [Ferrovum sp. JA12]
MKFCADRKWVVTAVMLLTIGLASCGGGGGGGTTTSSSATPTALQSTASVSNGTVTALGSVFVNGHEFDTNSANFVDADTGILGNSSNSALATSGLLSPEVGMTVAVNSATNSTNALPVAKEVRIAPLVRGYVDASDLTAGTITVMGQSVQVTSSTAFVDKRACVSTNTCSPTVITGQSNLVSTSGTTNGSYVIVYGYSYAVSGTSQVQIVATMVSAWDETNPIFTQAFVTDNQTSTELYPFKVSGIVTVSTTSNGTTYTIGGETLNLSTSSSTPICTLNGTQGSCSFITNGSFVSARGLVAPSTNVFLPNVVNASSGANSLNPGGATLQVSQTVEIEGTVSSVSGSTFVVRGVTVDGSALSVQLPVVGSKVELTGTVQTNGTILANSIQSDISSSLSRTIYTAPITISGITQGANASTNCSSSLPAYTISLLGQSMIVDCNTEIADRTATQFSAFNINNFNTYLSQLTITPVYVVVSTYVDASSNRRVNSFNVIKAPLSGFVSVSGLATSGAVGGVITPFTVQGITINYSQTNLTVNVGDYVTAVGALNSANSTTIDTTVTSGVLTVIPQTTLLSNALNHLGEHSDNGGGNLGFRGFDN